MDQQVKQIQPVAIVNNAPWLERYWYVPLAIALILVYFKYITIYEAIFALIVLVIINYILKHRAKKNEGNKLDYKPINLETEVPKIQAILRKIMWPQGISVLHLLKTEAYPDYGPTGEWPKEQHYLFLGQRCDTSFTKILVKEGFISREIKKIIPDYTKPEGTKFSFTGEQKYPMIETKTKYEPVQMVEPSKTTIKVLPSPGSSSEDEE